MPGRERNVERLVFFSDAVVAIAMTLLALPLTEVALNEHGATLHTAAVQLRLDLLPLLSAGLSFFVTARLWWAHHQLFARVERFTMPVVVTNFIWLFTVVVLSATTALVSEYTPSENRLVVGVYLGVLTLSGAALTSIAVAVHRGGAEVTTEGAGGTRDRVIGTASTTAAFFAALVIGTAFPVVGYWALLLLVPAGLVEDRLKRRAVRRE